MKRTIKTILYLFAASVISLSSFSVAYAEKTAIISDEIFVESSWDDLESRFQMGHFEDNSELNQFAFDPNEEGISLFASAAFPLSEYPAGSYFSNTGKTCTCHSGSNNPCWYTTPCDCLVYESAIQCVGFAKYVYQQYNGKSVSSASSNYTSYSITLTTSNVRQYIMSLPVGSYINVKYKNGGSHTMIIAKSDTSYVYLYHANWGGSCLVNYTKMAYADFVNYFPVLNSTTVA